MSKLRLFGGIVAAFAAVTVYSSTVQEALAIEAPTDIRVYIEDTDISTEDLNGDTLLTVPVYIENNPGLLSLNLFFQLDSRLYFEDMNAVRCVNDGLADVNVMTSQNWGGAICAELMSNGNSKFRDDGQIAELRVIIPDGTGAGTYPITLLESCGDSETSILIENRIEGQFGIECFSSLESGVITITEPYHEPPPPPPSVQNNDPEPQQNESENNETQNTAPAVHTTASVTAVSTASTSTTVKTTSAVTEQSTETSSSTAQATISSVTESSETTSAVVQTTVKTERKENNKKDSKFIIICAAAAAAVAATIFAVFKASSKRKGDKK